jgi:crotonobetainyl-CoA:carnitine CoA-transferase CaiB-like acyl-CoA transferase
MVVKTEDEATGTVEMIGNPVKIEPFASAEPSVRRAAPGLGADRAALLAEIQGRNG